MAHQAYKFLNQIVNKSTSLNNIKLIQEFGLINSTNTIHHFKSISKEIIVIKKIIKSHIIHTSLFFTKINVIS